MFELLLTWYVSLSILVCHCNLSDNVAKYELFMCYIYVNRNQRAFLAQMTSFVMRYDIIYHFFPFNSQYLMTWGVDSRAFYVWEVYVCGACQGTSMNIIFYQLNIK